MCTKLQLLNCQVMRKKRRLRIDFREIRIHSSINCKQMSTNVKMVDHLIRTGMDGKLVVWVITTGKSCLQPCFPRCFGCCIFQWTRHPERLSYQSVISGNSTAVTHCRVMMSLFYTETTALERQARATAETIPSLYYQSLTLKALPLNFPRSRSLLIFPSILIG